MLIDGVFIHAGETTISSLEAAAMLEQCIKDRQKWHL